MASICIWSCASSTDTQVAPRAVNGILDHTNWDFASNVFFLGGIFVIAVYHFGIYFLHRQAKSAIFFSAFCLLAAVGILTTGERYLMELFPAVSRQFLVKLEYLSYCLAVPAFAQFVYYFFPKRFSKRICTVFSITGLFFSAAVILLPVRLFSHSLPAYHLLTFVIFFYVLYVLLVAFTKKEPASGIFLAGFFVMFLTAVNDFLNNENIIQTGHFIPLGLFLFILSQACQQFLHFSKEGPEKRIDVRSAELLKANEQLHLEIKAREQAQESTIRAKWEAEKANKAKSDFLANMSHELRTPLGHIIGFTELVLDKKVGELNEVQSEYLNDVLNSSNHLLSLINDILDLSKVESGKLELRPSCINLKGLLENCLIMVKEKALKHGIKLSQQLNGIPDTITADERKLKQIIYNLLSNAVKFTPDGGTVSLSARTCEPNTRRLSAGGIDNNGAIEISVKDSGIGLNSIDFDRIFSPFEQVEVSRNQKFQGTGLGLSLTKNLINLHGGRIWVDSEGENKGATFSFIIPVTSPESSLDSIAGHQNGEN